MSKELKRMQKLAGIPANKEKESLNEHYVAGGIVGIGALNGGVPRKKSDYEMAFEHFIGEGYHTEKVNEAETAKGLFQMFKEKDLLDDRREYDIEDLMSAYPSLSKEEAKKLEQMLQNLDEAEEENSSKTSASTLGKDLKSLGNTLDTKGIQGKEADNFMNFIKKALDSIQANNLNSETAWKQLSAKLDALAGEKSESKSIDEGNNVGYEAAKKALASLRDMDDKVDFKDYVCNLDLTRIK